MKNTTPRRAFLQKSVMATSGIALFSTPVLHALTSSTTPFEGYNPYMEERTDLRTGILSDYLHVSGTIYDSSGTLPLSNTTIEVWHLSGTTGKYRHRGKLTTDAQGNYQFKTDMPGKKPGASSRIFFKVSGGIEPTFTELVITPFSALITDKHWETNRQLGNKLFPKYQKFLNETKINFNISVN